MKKYNKTSKKGKYFLGGMFDTTNKEGEGVFDFNKFSTASGAGAQATGAPNYVDASYIPEEEKNIERDLTGVAENIPIIGGIAKAGSRLSTAVRGDETSGFRNAVGDQLGGFNTIKAIASGNFKEAIPIYGGFEKAKRRKREKAEEEDKARQLFNQQEINRSSSILSGYDSFGKGDFAKGGYLARISKSAVEVVADNPKKTDSVELENAFVDDKEIIDNQNRVFSTQVTLPNGKPISKEAKRLEKMKREGYTSSNKRIDDKLNSLFGYQESLKEKESNKLALGGTISETRRKRSSDKPPVQPEKTWTGSIGDFLIDNIPLGREISRHLLDYDPELDQAVEFQSQPEQMARQADEITRFKEKMKKLESEEMSSLAEGGYLDQKKDIGGDLINALGTYGPNVINSRLISNTPEVPTPKLEGNISLGRINDRALQAELKRRGILQRKATNMNTAQSSTANAQNAAILSEEIQAMNRLRSDTDRINTDIKSRETALNLGINARNTGYLNKFQDSKIDRKNRMSTLRSQNMANVSSKVMQQRAEKNRMELDQKRLDIIEGRFNDSGVLDRFYKDLLQKQIDNIKGE